MSFFDRKSLRRRKGKIVRPLGCATLAACVWSVALVSPALAEDLKVEASLAETAVWDTNPMMRTQDVKTLYGATTTPRFHLEKETPTSGLSLTTWLENNVFNLHEFDSTDFHGQTELNKKTQRLSTALGLTGDYDTTRTSELTTFGLDTGTIRHLGYSASPTVEYALSPLSKVGLTGNYSKSIYDASNYVDYHTFSASTSYQQNFNERYAGVLALSARRYQSDEGPERFVDSIGPTLGVLATITPEWSAELRAGREVSRDKLDGMIVQDWTWNSIYTAKLHYKGDQDQFLFSSERAQQAYANGTDSLLTTLAVRDDHRINELFSVNMALSYQFSDDEQTTDNRLDNLYAGNLGVTYHVTSSFGLSTSYGYKRETFTREDGIARQNIVRLGLTYRPEFEALW